MVDKREYKLKRRLRSQTLRHMVTFLITVRSPEVVIRSAIIPPSKYSRHESSIRDVEIACGIRGYFSVGYVYLRRFPNSKFRLFVITSVTQKEIGRAQSIRVLDSLEDRSRVLAREEVRTQCRSIYFDFNIRFH